MIACALAVCRPARKRHISINLQEIKGIAFGTPTPINYFDSFYNAELYLRTNGYFSIRITDPIRFYAEAIPHDRDMVTIEDIQKLYVAEFLTAFQTAVNRMSVDGIRISHVTSKAMELAKYMGEVLDESWKEKRGMSIESVGINSISYDEQSKKLIDMRNQGAMLSDPTIREGYVQGEVARGMEAAGSNRAGASVGFMNMNMGMQQGGGFVAAASRANQVQQNLEAQSRTADRQTDGWVCTAERTTPVNSAPSVESPRRTHPRGCAAAGPATPENSAWNVENLSHPARFVRSADGRAAQCGFVPSAEQN